MKKLLFVLSFFAAVCAQAQGIKISALPPFVSANDSAYLPAAIGGVTYKIALSRIGVNDVFIRNDSLFKKKLGNVLFVGKVNTTAGSFDTSYFINLIDSLVGDCPEATVDYVSNIAALKAYTGPANIIIVGDTLRGGVFSYISNEIDDEGLFFDATGKGSGSYIRQYNAGNSIDVRWFGVVGNGITDDATAFTNCINAGNTLKAKITIPPGFIIGLNPIVISDLNYIWLEGNNFKYKALGGTVGAGGTAFITISNVKVLNLGTDWSIDANYPICNRDWAMIITAPNVMAGSLLNIGSLTFENLPLSGLKIVTATDDGLHTGYEFINSTLINGINASNKRNVPLSTDFNYLYVRGAHGYVSFQHLNLQQDSEVWGDNNQSPNCKMFSFSSEANSIYPHMKNLYIGELTAKYAAAVVLFFQGIDNFNVESIVFDSTLRKPGVADASAYTNFLSKAYTFFKADYALPNRTENRGKIGSFVMKNTNTVINTASNFVVGMWIDEGLEDCYIDRIDSDVRVQFYGTGSTTQASGHHIINSLTYRAQSKPNTIISVTKNGTIVNTLKLINSDAAYSFGSGIVGNILQEGIAAPSLYFDASSADTTNVRSDGSYSGTTILNGTLLNANVYLQIHYDSTVWTGSAKDFGYKYTFNNIRGGATLICQLFKNNSNITPATYDGFFETQMKDYYELQMNNCQFKLSQSGSNIAYRYFLSEPIFLNPKDLTATNTWAMPLKNNQFTNTYLPSTTDDNYSNYLYFNNSVSKNITGALPINSLYDYEFIIDNNGANRSQGLPLAKNTAGKKYRYVKTSSDAFTITLSPTAGNTIAGGSSYILPATVQEAEFESDNVSDWKLNYINYNFALNTSGSDVAYSNGTLSIPSASATASGKVNISAQSFGGDKTFSSGGVFVGTTSLTAAATYYSISNTSPAFAGIASLQGGITKGRMGLNGSNQLEIRVANSVGTVTSAIPFIAEVASGNVAITTSTSATHSSNFQVDLSSFTLFGTVTVTASGTTVSGTGTGFLNTFKVGDDITANSETHTITAIASDVSMTTDAWTNAASAVTYSSASGGTRFVVKGNGRVGTGGITSPTAFLHLGAGAATAGRAPLKFTSGTSLTTPEAGAMEFDGTHFYGTVGSTRYQLDQQTASGVVISVSGTSNQISSTGGTSPVLSLVSGGTLPGAWALGTPTSIVLTNGTGTAAGLTSGITNALKSATTTVDVSAATAPTAGQVLTATSGTAATWQTPGTGGTVTTISVVTANGVSGSVANASTTPAITLTLGAITPTTVNGNTFTTGSSTYTGTAAQTYTFPTTTATIARTDAAQTFVGNMTFSNSIQGNTSTSYSYKIAGGSGGLNLTEARFLPLSATNINTTAAFGTSTTLVLTAGAIYSNLTVGSMPITEAGSGTHALLANLIVRPIGAITGAAATVNNTATLYVESASSATVTGENLAFWVASGTSRFDGDIKVGTAGKGIQYQSGTGARAGNATLIAGTITVTNTTVTANTIITLTRKTSGGTIGTAITYTLSAGASFTINSDSPLDTSTFTYVLDELN